MILKLKQTPALFLVGFMGSGKSTIGRLVAGKMGWSFVDLDDDIERKAGKPIPEIFDREGEEAFRALETEALRERIKEVRRGRPMVISLGGGTFAQKDNAELTAQYGVSIWLDCAWDRIERRVAQETHRPLARDPEKLRRLFDARRAAYTLAEHRIAITCDDPAVAAEEILALPIFK
jgi:shikimate kinase